MSHDQRNYAEIDTDKERLAFFIILTVSAFLLPGTLKFATIAIAALNYLYYWTVRHLIYIYLLRPVLGFFDNILMEFVRITLENLLIFLADILDWFNRCREAGHILSRGVGAIINSLAILKDTLGGFATAWSGWLATIPGWRPVFVEWSTEYRTPVATWALVLYVTYQYMADGSRLLATIVATTIVFFALHGQHLSLAFWAPIISGFYKIYNRYKQHKIASSRYATGYNQPKWTKLTALQNSIAKIRKKLSSGFSGPEISFTSKIPDKVVNHVGAKPSQVGDQTTDEAKTNTRTSRSSLVNVFLPKFSGSQNSEQLEVETPDMIDQETKLQSTISKGEELDIDAIMCGYPTVDKLAKRVVKATENISSSTHEHHRTASKFELHNSSSVQPLPMVEALMRSMGYFLGGVWTIPVTSISGAYNFVSASVPPNIGRFLRTLDGIADGSSRATALSCSTFWMPTVLYYSSGILLIWIASPFIKSVLFRTKYKPYTPTLILLACLLWTPCLISTGTVAYQTPLSIAETMKIFRGNLYLQLFAILAGAKLLRILMNTFSYHFLSHHNVNLSRPGTVPWHVTVIVAYPFRTAHPPSTYIRSVKSFLAHRPYNIILLTRDHEACLAAENFSAAFGSEGFEVVMSLATDPRRRFLAACSKVRTSLTVLARGYVTWPDTFLRCALPPFDNPLTAVVAPALHPYMTPLPPIPVFVGQVSPPPPAKPTWKQKFITFVINARFYRYNFTNTATYNLDGGVLPLSHNTLLIRTEILRSTAFQRAYLQASNAQHLVTQFVQSCGLRTVFLNSPDVIVHIAIPPPHANSKLSGYLANVVLLEQRTLWSYTLTCLFWDRTTYAAFPWSTFAGHLALFFDLPLLYDGAILFALHRATGTQYLWAAIVTLVVLQAIKNLAALRKPSELGYFAAAVVWEYVVESWVHLWAFLTVWKGAVVEQSTRKGSSVVDFVDMELDLD